MKAAEARRARILARHRYGEEIKENARLEGCSIDTVYRTLRAAGEYIRQPSLIGHVQPHPDSDKYGLGDCLMCKAGTYKDRTWEGGVCPCCGGSGKYPDSIMKLRHERGEE